MNRVILILLSVLILQTSVYAKKTEPDLALVKVTKNIYAIVGSLGNRTKQNLGNNATFGVVVTKKGVVLIDSGATYEGAERIHQLIRSITKQPVKIVINSGGQDHRWLGNDYFKKQGAQIIANQRAVADQKQRKQNQLFRLGNLLGASGLQQTEARYADKTFDQAYGFDLGGTSFKLVYAGQAHTPGDSFVWLPSQKVVFTGDIVYTERMLSIHDSSKSKTWLSAFEAFAALKPEFVVPGHGRPTSLALAKKDTYDYLYFLRKSVAEFMQLGGGIEDIGNLDQSLFGYLKNFNALKGRNAQQVYQELEFE
ncbi:MBL-fold metallo-hydrolase superfamily [hydrothermal vent metagenome]|uniref:MBL-fold metallo-hydrolase superfamily n=1 Tax=hydrothermal vent metagenome TaxID=652676 RepID=A0A3B1AI03_9ZZZZ